MRAGVLPTLALAACAAFAPYGAAATDASAPLTVLPHHSFRPPFLDTYWQGALPYWEMQESTIVMGGAVRLVPAFPKRAGVFENTVPLGMDHWEINMRFKVHGKTTGSSHGFAVWLTEETPTGAGPIWGQKADFNGIGVVVDTYDDNGQPLEPSISLIVNDGSAKDWKMASDMIGATVFTCTGAAGLRVVTATPEVFRAAAMRIVYSFGKLDVYYMRASGSKQEVLCGSSTEFTLPKKRFLSLSGMTGAFGENVDIISFEVSGPKGAEDALEGDGVDDMGVDINDPEVDKAVKERFQDPNVELNMEREHHTEVTQRKHRAKAAEKQGRVPPGDEHAAMLKHLADNKVKQEADEAATQEASNAKLTQMRLEEAARVAKARAEQAEEQKTGPPQQQPQQAVNNQPQPQQQQQQPVNNQQQQGGYNQQAAQQGGGYQGGYGNNQQQQQQQQPVNNQQQQQQQPQQGGYNQGGYVNNQQQAQGGGYQQNAQQAQQGGYQQGYNNQQAQGYQQQGGYQQNAGGGYQGGYVNNQQAQQGGAYQGQGGYQPQQQGGGGGYNQGYNQQAQGGGGYQGGYNNQPQGGGGYQQQQQQQQQQPR